MTDEPMYTSIANGCARATTRRTIGGAYDDFAIPDWALPNASPRRGGEEREENTGGKNPLCFSWLADHTGPPRNVAQAIAASMQHL